DLLAPQFILCLGATAAQALLQRTDSISRLRAKLHNYRGAKVVCTYHPSYILRSPEKARRPVWEDLLLLMGEMGIRPKNKQS
ncbi:MAG TPA: uracil-DNA glycosylase family protein, partial [Pirellulales bacterium]